jgi:hypothetical protein
MKGSFSSYLELPGESLEVPAASGTRSPAARGLGAPVVCKK